MNKVKFSDIANFTAGQSPKSEFYTSNPINSTPFLQGNRTFGHMYPEIDTYTTKITKLAKKGEVLMSVRAPVGDLNIAPVDVCIGRGLSGICSKTGDNMFLYYALKYNTPNLVKRSNGTTFEAINKDIVNQMEMIMPSDLLTQKKVSSLLSNIDSKIENNNKIISELESLAKTIYDYWFLQFEFPNEDGKPYKSSGGKMVWNEELKREIPEGWEIHNISNLCTLGNGINYDKKVTGDKTYKIVNVRDISASSLLINKQDMNEITLPKELANKYLVNKGDILIARSGTPGAVRLVLDTDNVIYCGFIIHCLPNDLEDRFYLTFTLKLYEGTSATKTGGSILQNVSQDTLKSLTIPLPSKNILSSFNIKIKPLIDRMQLCIEENNQLASLRDFLLPLLMNGQVTFKEVE